jgi:erythromycin esterase
VGSLAQQPAPAQRSAANDVLEWIRRNAVRISAATAGSGFADLSPLKRAVGDARIVALGEATHGTREFFQLKHRMLEFLVTEMGFSIFSIEANMPEAYHVNEYVLKGEGDPAKLVQGMRAWTWDTQEVLDMVRWMRDYNRSGKGPVQFTGFDMQSPVVAIENVRDFIARWNQEFLPVLERVVDLTKATRGDRNASEAIRTAALEWEKIVTHMEARRSRREEGSEWAIQNARVAYQCMRMGGELAAPLKAMAWRDSCMATNIKWILDQSKSAKIALWAHNWHVKTGKGAGNEIMMGPLLRKMYGDQLTTFGFAFHQGSFRAMSRNGTVQTFSVKPAPVGSLDAMLATSGIPLMALNLRDDVPRNGPVADWFRAPHATRNIFQGYAEEVPGGNMFEQVMTDEYDHLVFVEQTTASRPNTPR